jgi:hypothetical protein
MATAKPVRVILTPWTTVPASSRIEHPRSVHRPIMPFVSFTQIESPSRVISTAGAVVSELMGCLSVGCTFPNVAERHARLQPRSHKATFEPGGDETFDSVCAVGDENGRCPSVRSGAGTVTMVKVEPAVEEQQGICFPPDFFGEPCGFGPGEHESDPVTMLG